jgi:hypothetical protein
MRPTRLDGVEAIMSSRKALTAKAAGCNRLVGSNMKWVDNYQDEDDRPHGRRDKEDDREDRKQHKPKRTVKVCVETRTPGGPLERSNGIVIHERVQMPNPQAGEPRQPYKLEYARLLVDGREELIPSSQIVGWFPYSTIRG